MYRFAAIVEVDTEDLQQVNTVRRKTEQALRSTFAGAPYPVRGAVSPSEWIEKGGEPVIITHEAPAIVTPEIVTP